MIKSSVSEGDDLAERRADDHRDREIEHVAACDEGLELLEHAASLLWCPVFHCT